MVVCALLVPGGPLAQTNDRATATVSVTATVRPSCAIRVGDVTVAAAPPAPPAQLTCHPDDAARAVVTTVMIPAGATSASDPVTRLVTIQF